MIFSEEICILQHEAVPPGRCKNGKQMALVAGKYDVKLTVHVGVAVRVRH